MKKITGTNNRGKGGINEVKNLCSKHMVKRLLAFALSFFMVNSTIDYPGLVIANAAVEIKAYTITAFEALDGTKEYQTLSFGAEESDILFPDSLKAAVEYTVYEKPEEYLTEENTAAGEEFIEKEKNEDPAGTVILSGNDSGDTAPDSNEGEEIKRESIIIEGITWELDKEKSDLDVFTSDAGELAEYGGGCFVYTAVIPEMDIDGNTYTLAGDVELPEICVVVEDADDGVMLLNSSDTLDVSALETRSITFGYGYSDYVVIDSDNVDEFNGKTLTGTTTNGIFISNNTTVNLTIEDLNITKSQDISSCISVGYGATLNLTVKGDNTLKAAGWGGAGIEVMGQTKATLRITADSTGTLTAKGGYGEALHGSYGGAGIGGMARITSDIKQVYVGNIIIEGGTINAAGGYQAAGIGGTIGESGGNITITGGTVNATGGSYAAGIGGGSNGNVDSITIGGGTVTATGGNDGAAIGVGYQGASAAGYVFSLGTISITGGAVTANGNIGYGNFRNENNISGASGTVSVSENVYINVTGEVKTGNGDSGSTAANKYTVNFTVYDGRFIDAASAKIQLGDTVLAESAAAELLQIGKLSVPFSFTTGRLTGSRSFTLTIDGREYQKTIVFEEGTTGYDATIGTPLYPVTLEFYDEAITSDLEAASVTVKQDNAILSADKGEYYAPAKVSKVENYYGRMLLYLPANSKSTELSVTVPALNTGNAMEKSGQTISDTDTNTIVMLESEQIVLCAEVGSKGAAAIDARLTLNTVGTTVYYVKSETAITDAAEIENAATVASTTVENTSTTVSLSGSAENESTYYFVAKKEGAYSNISSLTFTTNGEAKLKIQGEETETYYDNWYNAIEAARGKTATVTLLCSRMDWGVASKNNYEAIKSVTIKDGDDITIDMKGCKYSPYIINMTAPLITVEGGKCTITGNGKLYGENGASSYRMLYITGGEVVIDGNIKMDANGLFNTQGDPIHVNGENAVLRITGGVTIGRGNNDWYNAWNNSSYAEKAKEISITNGRYESPVQLENVKTVSISGGRFGGCGGNGINIVRAEGVSISGGTFGEYSGCNLALNIEAADSVLISGGTFKKTVGLRNGALSGGIFSNTLKLTDSDGGDRTSGDDLSSLLAVGYTYRKSDNTTTKGEGSYSISDVSVVETAKTSIEGAAVTLGTDTVTYSGEAQTPAVSRVVLNNTTLTENTDYTVSYENNVNVGTATVIVTGAGENYNGSVTKTFTIEKKPVTVSGITARNKTYNGTTAAILDCSAAVLDGVSDKDKDTLIVSSATGTFADANAEENKVVTISGITLGGTSAGNYVLAGIGQQTETNAAIKPKKVMLAWSGNTSLTYNGNEQSVTATVKNAIGSDSFTLAYENSGTNTNKATEAGNYTAKVTALGNDNYTLEGAGSVSKEWSIGYLAAEDAAISGTTGDNGWYLGAVTLTPLGGYTISADKNIWQDTLTVSGEGIQTVEYYLKNATGGITDKKSAEIKIDTAVPTGKIRIKDNGFTGFLNKITFGYFFKETVDVSITGEDATSGVNTIEYQKVESAGDYKADGTWMTGSSFFVEPGEKFIVYARITDKAGNKTIINSEGTVVYTDVAATVSAEFIKTSAADVEVGASLNGNTVASIVMGAAPVAADSFLVSDDKLILKADWLNTLAAGRYTLTVSYNPMGESFISGTSRGDAPQTTELVLTVKKAALTVTEKPILSGIYGTKVEDMTIETANALAVNTSGVKVSGTWSITDANKSEMPSVGTSVEYELTFTPDSSVAGDYDSVTCKVAPVVSRKAVSVTIEDAVRKYKEADPYFTYTLAEGSTLAGNDTIERLAITTSAEADESSDVGEYDITGVSANGNYEVNIIGGTLTITKAAAPDVLTENKSYAYTKGSDGSYVTVNIAGKLPDDRGATNYMLSVTDQNSIIDGAMVDDKGNLTYKVRANTTAGLTATMIVTASMHNYEDAAYTLTITIVDKTIVSEKSGSGVAVSGSSTLTYGQRLSALSLNTGEASFVEQGTDTAVAGILTWKNPDEVLSAGTTTATWIFTPADGAAYQELEGSVAVSVAKAAPILTAPAVSTAVYSPKAVLENDFKLTGGSARHIVGGVETDVEGNFSWQNGKAVPTVDNTGYIAVFTPDDSTNYDSAAITVTVTIEKATPIVSTVPAAAELTYGQCLSESSLSGGVAGMPGTFAWTDGSIKPGVSDSNSSEYGITFTPSDETNYNTASCKVKVTVNKAENAPNMPGSTMSTANSITKVGDVSLSDYMDWAWQDGDKDKELAAGTAVTATAVYIGADKGSYVNESVTVSITRSLCAHADTEVKNARTATCQDEGYTGDTYCKDCNTLLCSGSITAALGHSYTSKVTKEPTTTTEGVMTYICANCGHSYTQAIEKLQDDDNTGAPDDNPGSTDNKKPGTDMADQNTDSSKPETGKPFIKGDSGKNGWDVIRSRIEAAKDGETINVDMNGSTIVPQNIFESIKDRDITVIFDMGDEVTWTVNGKDIKNIFGDIDFGIAHGKNAGAGIPLDIINNVTGERYRVNLTLAHDGEFGFAAVLTINMDKKNAGLYANLFYFNKQTGKLEFICSDEIDTAGNAGLVFTHASDYTVIVDEKPMDSVDAGVDDSNSEAETDNGNNSDAEIIESPHTGNVWLPYRLIVLGAIMIILGAGAVLMIKK